MKYYEVGFDAGVCYSCNIIQGETEAACRYAAEQHAKRYGYTIGYFEEIAESALEYNRKPVWNADRYPEPTEPDQPETETAEADETKTETNEQEEETMKNYDYMNAVCDDVREYIENEIDAADWTSDREGLEEKLNDDLFVDDSVTGNASGSYFCNAYRAKQAFLSDPKAEEYFAECCADFGMDAAEVGKHFIRGDYEYFDVTIRCYLLGQAVSKVLDELEEAGYFDEVNPDEIAF